MDEVHVHTSLAPAPGRGADEGGTPRAHNEPLPWSIAHPLRTDRASDIVLRDECTPQRTLHTPVHDASERKSSNLVQALLEKGVIRAVPEETAWVSQAHCYETPDERKVRLYVDYRSLNAATTAPDHPLLHASQLLSRLERHGPLLATIQLQRGPYQVPLTPTAARSTTFLLPEGKFCFLFAPPTLAVTPSLWHQQVKRLLEKHPYEAVLGDEAWVVASTRKELRMRADALKERASQHHVLCKSPILHMERPHSLGGYTWHKGTATPHHQARNVLAHLPASTRAEKTLLARLLKHVEEHHGQPKEVKPAQVAAPAIDFSKEFVLATDAARTGNVAYALMQRATSGETALIRCGSAPITPAQRSWATIELEALAVDYALHQNQDILSYVTRVKLESDNQPLVTVLSKSVTAVANERLSNMRRRMSPVHLSCTYIPAQDNVIPDALSRLQPLHKGRHADTNVKEHVRSAHIRLIKDACATDHSYLAARNALRSGTSYKDLPNGPGIKFYKCQWHALALDSQELITCGDRLVVPLEARKPLLQCYMKDDPGQDEQLYVRRLKGLFAWPRLDQDAQAEHARQQAPSQPQVHAVHEPPPRLDVTIAAHSEPRVSWLFALNDVGAETQATNMAHKPQDGDVAELVLALCRHGATPKSVTLAEHTPKGPRTRRVCQEHDIYLSEERELSEAASRDLSSLRTQASHGHVETTQLLTGPTARHRRAVQDAEKPLPPLMQGDIIRVKHRGCYKTVRLVAFRSRGTRLLVQHNGQVFTIPTSHVQERTNSQTKKMEPKRDLTDHQPWTKASYARSVYSHRFSSEEVSNRSTAPTQPSKGSWAAPGPTPAQRSRLPPSRTSPPDSTSSSSTGPPPATPVPSGSCSPWRSSASRSASTSGAGATSATRRKRSPRSPKAGAPRDPGKAFAPCQGSRRHRSPRPPTWSPSPPRPPSSPSKTSPTALSPTATAAAAASLP